MSLTIYGIAASRAVRPLWAAHELGLDFKHIPLDYQGGGTRARIGMGFGITGFHRLRHGFESRLRSGLVGHRKMTRSRRPITR